jgi:mRNA-degrading endonuclease RelE of RelBE toxin-antitoxin system
MERRVHIQWTEAACLSLRALPKNVAKGLYRKAGELKHADDPRLAGKPLKGPLQGYYRMTFGRHRALYSVREVNLEAGEEIVEIRVVFVLAGVRREGSRKDIYQVALRLYESGLLDLEDPGEAE